MKLVFVHDGTLKYDQEGAYYGTAVTPYSLSRYQYMSDDITVVIRTCPFREGESKERYMRIPPEYHIEHVDNYMSVRGMLFERGKVKKKLEAIIDKADLVVCRFSGETGKIAASICHKKQKPYIVECVGCAWDSFWNYNIKGKIIAPYQYVKQKRLIRKAPYVIYVTNQFLQKRYPTSGKSIAASNVELRKMSDECLDIRLKKIAEKKPDEPVILGTAAAIDVPYKGQAYVIKAISDLNKRGYNFRYQVIGTGDKSRLEAVAREYGVLDKVDFLGVLPQNKVFDWVDTLDIYVQPSDQEGLPRALIEAMSRACPCIGSSTAGIPELLDKKAIFRRKHVDQLIDALQCMDVAAQLENAKRNYKVALDYQRETIYQRRNDFYDMVMAENGLSRRGGVE